jgi:hypothetical protein
MAEFRAAWPKNGPVKFLPGREVCGLESGPAPNFLKGIVQPLKRGLMGGINSGTGRIWQPGASLHQDRRRSSEEASTPLPTPPPPRTRESSWPPTRPLTQQPPGVAVHSVSQSLSSSSGSVCVWISWDGFIHSSVTVNAPLLQSTV